MTSNGPQFVCDCDSYEVDVIESIQAHSSLADLIKQARQQGLLKPVQAYGAL